MPQTSSRIWFYWERLSFLKEQGFKYVYEENCYVDTVGWKLTGAEIYDTIDAMTYEAFRIFVISRPKKGDQ